MENNCERKVNKNCKVFVAVVLNKFLKKITTMNLFILTFKKFYFVKKRIKILRRWQRERMNIRV